MVMVKAVKNGGCLAFGLVGTGLIQVKAGGFDISFRKESSTGMRALPKAGRPEGRFGGRLTLEYVMVRVLPRPRYRGAGVFGESWASEPQHSIKTHTVVSAVT